MPFHRLTRKCLKPGPFPEGPKTLGEHVKAKRLEAGLHQAELAAQLGVDEFTVLNWENGHTMPRVSYYGRVVAGGDRQRVSLGRGVVHQVLSG
ncbi:MAG: helix-turn-helix transcriptional regulator [bacterium]|nr:helix-turn-helix transcriptional regulator [bacterium]